MKRFILPLVFFSAAAMGLANMDESYRTFTDDQGRTIEAVIVRTAPDEIWIRRDDGQTFRVPLSTFSKADRAYIEQWEIDTALKSPTAFEFAVRRYSDGRRTTETSSTRSTTEKFGYIVSVTNNTTIDLENLSVEYRCYALRGDLDRRGQKRPLEPHSGNVWIRTLPARGTEELKTTSIALTSTSLKAAWSYASTNRRHTKDSLGGVWIRVRQNGKLIAEFSSPSGLKDEQNW